MAIANSCAFKHICTLNLAVRRGQDISVWMIVASPKKKPLRVARVQMAQRSARLLQQPASPTKPEAYHLCGDVAIPVHHSRVRHRVQVLHESLQIQPPVRRKRVRKRSLHVAELHVDGRMRLLVKLPVDGIPNNETHLGLHALRCCVQGHVHFDALLLADDAHPIPRRCVEGGYVEQYVGRHGEYHVCVCVCLVSLFFFSAWSQRPNTTRP